MPRWVVAQIREPGFIDRRIAVEVENLVCTAGQDWRTTRSPSSVQDWTCDRYKITSSAVGHNSSLPHLQHNTTVLVACSYLLNRYVHTAASLHLGVLQEDKSSSREGSLGIGSHVERMRFAVQNPKVALHESAQSG